jgi:hypothetical protein
MDETIIRNNREQKQYEEMLERITQEVQEKLLYRKCVDTILKDNKITAEEYAYLMRGK